MKKILLPYLYILWGFFTPLAPLLTLVFISIVIDTFVGRWYAKQTNKPILSKITRVGVVRKLITYFGGLTFIFLVDTWILNNFFLMYFQFDLLLTHIVTLFIIWIEYSSVDEKIKWVKGKGITDRVCEFIRKVKKGVSVVKETKDSL
jgi:divalent metal cation (Fe/Co/Zn/Cd) transporter